MQTIPFRRKLACLSLLLLSLIGLPTVRAGSASWSLNPGSGDWSTAGNWTPNTIPNGPADTATFSVSNTTGISVASNIEVQNITFNPGASGFHISVVPSATATFTDLTISGEGVVNNSGIVQNFETMTSTAGHVGEVLFTGSASAGDSVVYTNDGGGIFATAKTSFSGSASAGHATFVANGSPKVRNSQAGLVLFLDSATAANGTFTANGGVLGGAIVFASNSTAAEGTYICNGGIANGTTGGVVQFGDTSQGGNGVFTINGTNVSGAGGGIVTFIEGSTTANCTLIANAGASGGGVDFFGSAGGSARVELFGNGHLDMSGGVSAVTIGSLEGDGQVFLGANYLSIGANALSTTFSGGIFNAGGFYGGTGGGLAKIGVGSFELSEASVYVGGTTVAAGTLIVSNSAGSATGTGAVTVNGGTLGGSGIIAGAVTLNATGNLAPAHGSKTPTTTTMQSSLTFNSGSTYTYTFKAKGNRARTDKVIANGVTINSGATFSLKGTAQGTLTHGLVLTAIANTAGTPIAGTFGNLPDGASVTVGSNTLQVNYEGGTGNDLTLTAQ